MLHSSKLPTHLEAACQSQRVQQWNKDKIGDDNGKHNTDDVQRVLGAVDVHLGWGAQDQDGGDERYQNGDGNGNDTHTPIGHKKFIGCSLLIASAAVKDADSRRNDQHQGKDD